MTSDQAIADAISRGQALEIAGDRAGAQAHYQAIWARATRTANQYQASIAAHFMAHAQTEAEAQRMWHQRALRAAEAALALGDERMRAFLPSLHANLAEVSLRLGRRAQARAHLDQAHASEAALHDDGYGRMMRGLIARLAQELANDP